MTLIPALLFCCLPGLLALDDPAASPSSAPQIDEAIERAIKAGDIPGAVVIVGRGGETVFAKAYGRRAVEPESEPMTRDTIFDLASLTKPIATATSVMLLIERGQIRLDDPISKFLPEFAEGKLGGITVEQLLRHRGGLIPDNAADDYTHGAEEAWKRIAALEPTAKPDEKFIYSDVGFLILGRIVEKVSGKPLDQFARENIFEPLKMKDAGYLPAESLKPRIAPTEREGDEIVRGYVHDPRSRSLGGVAGHAGLFATADDLAIYANMLLDGGKGILKPETVRLMTDPGTTPEKQKRGLGWDIATGYSAPRGERFGPHSFGHTGFTGTSIWIDPETNRFVILLASRLHGAKKSTNTNPLRSQVATAAADAFPAEPAATGTEASGVLCGIDVLIAKDFAPLKGKRVGLITNHTGLARDGRTTIDVLFKAPEVKLTALFSPEHGIRGLLDVSNISDSKDEVTGLPVHSLYGKTRKPTPEHLKDIDVLVYDIQDIGARFYTYVSTLGLALEAAKERGIPLMVLDRPNPIGGIKAEGPVRDESFGSFIAFHDIPVRHGMTVGELAKMFNAERKVGAELEVIACEGWKRSDFYDRTGLLWVNPSPNMRSLTEALLYPGVGLLEATNIATGRGTDTPFERIGAPWISDPVAWAQDLNARQIPGARFVPIRFSPTERQFAKQQCNGVYIAIDDWKAFDPIRLGIELSISLRKNYPNDWKPESLLKFITDQATYDAILAGKDWPEVEALWAKELDEFLARRKAFLIYD